MSVDNLKQHQLITFKPKSQEAAVTGFISKLTASKVEVIFDRGDELRCLSNPASHTPKAVLASLDATPHAGHAGTPISDSLQEQIDKHKAFLKAPKIVKGHVVEYEHEGKRHTGRVLSGGKKPRVSHSSTLELGIPAMDLTLVDLPTPDPELSEWAASKFTSHGIRMDGEAFTIAVTRNGKHVMDVCDNGDGGPAIAYPTKKGSQADINDLERILMDYAEKHDFWLHEPIGLWAEYAWSTQPDGTTFADYADQDPFE